MDITDWRKPRRSVGNGACVQIGSWRTASYSMNHGNCLEAGNFRTSSRCGASECLEAGNCAHGVAVRDTVLAPSSPVLFFSAGEWKRFVGRVKDGHP